MAETESTESTPLDIPQNVYETLHPNIQELAKLVDAALVQQKSRGILDDVKLLHDTIANLPPEQKQGEAYQVAKKLMLGVNDVLLENKRLRTLHRSLASAYVQEVIKDAGNKASIIKDMFKRPNYRHIAGAEPVRLTPDKQGNQHFVQGGSDNHLRSGLYSDFLRAKKADVQTGTTANVEQLQRDLKLDQDTVDRLNCEIAPLFTSFLGT
jgi:hypothetical protein